MKTTQVCKCIILGYYYNTILTSICSEGNRRKNGLNSPNTRNKRGRTAQAAKKSYIDWNIPITSFNGETHLIQRCNTEQDNQALKEIPSPSANQGDGSPGSFAASHSPEDTNISRDSDALGDSIEFDFNVAPKQSADELGRHEQLDLRQTKKGLQPSLDQGIWTRQSMLVISFMALERIMCLSTSTKGLRTRNSPSPRCFRLEGLLLLISWFIAVTILA